MSNLADIVLERPEAAPVGLLDTRKTSEHLRLPSPPTKELAEAKRKKRKAEHRRVVQALKSMAAGDHGHFAQTIGGKWIGDVAHCGGRSSVHGPCRQPSWLPQSCKFPLCPWYQASRARKAGERLHALWMQGLFSTPSMATFTVQNVQRLGDGWYDLSRALKALHRRQYVKGRVRGGFRALETTISKDGKWNAHSHELLDADYLPIYPMTDIALRAGRWVVLNEHPGLMRLWTMECQSTRKENGRWIPRYPTLYRQGINVDCPEHWYIVNIKQADYGGIKEIAKYIAKSDAIVSGGVSRMIEYLLARRGRRMLQGFGSMYKVNLNDLDDDESEAPVAPSECPFTNCPDPAAPNWQFLAYGPLDGWEKSDRDPRTGRYRLTLNGESRIPPDLLPVYEVVTVPAEPPVRQLTMDVAR